MKLNPSISLFFIISSMHAATYMEQTQQWISWGSTRKLVPAGQQLLFDSQAPMPAVAPFYRGQSWEEKAFAEDSAGLLMWPPRSYSCNFCAREFRSAQALGGHMNVHRRDRARLKQSYAGELDEDHPRTISSHVASSSSGALEDCENDDQQRKHVSATELRLGGEGLRLGFDEEEDEPRESKRLRRIINDGMVCLPLPSLAPHHHSIQELDLELRLGDGSAQE